VVVLYRNNWGTTPWTRIEETAIRNRAFDEGYSFVIFVPLDTPPAVPKWLPKTQLWIGLARWGINGAASVIEARFQELGGEFHEESVTERAVRLEREANFSERRRRYINLGEGIKSAEDAYDQVLKTIETQIPTLKSAASSLQIETKRAQRQLIVLSDPISLSVGWRRRLVNSLDEAALHANVWEGHPPFPGIMFFYEPRRLSERVYLPDVFITGEAAWSIRERGETRLLAPDQAAESILKWWLDHATKHQQSRR